MWQTSIRLTTSAREALARLCARTGSKLEPAVRHLLTQLVERQQALDEDHRLTHLAIALCHPPGTRLPGDPPPTERLPIRRPLDLQREAESYSYRIPGRPARQSHRDYASRPLSGAVTTAIALAEPFQEPELEGLPMLVEHRLGDGLWRLTAAASLTGEEHRALAEGSAPLPQMLVDGEVMWHSPERSTLARQIATNLLTGPGAADHLAILSAQQEDFQDGSRSSLIQGSSMAVTRSVTAPHPSEGTKRGGRRQLSGVRAGSLPWRSSPPGSPATTPRPPWSSTGAAAPLGDSLT